MSRWVCFALTAMLPFVLGVASCQPKVEDSGPYALAAGNATMLLGGCERPMEMGYSVCQLQRGQKIPALKIGFTNPGEWAVSDCKGGFYKSGKTDSAGVVEVDLEGLSEQANRNGFCWLRLESTERYPANEDKNQLKSLAMAGGFIIEFLEPGYMPVPAQDVVAWCFKVERTTKGRTLVSKCR